MEKRRKKRGERNPTWAGPANLAHLATRTNRLPPQHVLNVYITSTMAVANPLVFPRIIAPISSRVQHETYSELYGHLIQRIYFPLSCLKQPDRPDAPNAKRWHASPDLPPQTKPILTKHVTLCPSFFSIIFVLKLSPEELCTYCAIDVLS